MVAAALATCTIAHNIQMGAHSRECFHEELHKDDKMTVTFQVGDREFGGAGNLEIDFWVSTLTPPCTLRFVAFFKEADRVEPSAIASNHTYFTRYSTRCWPYLFYLQVLDPSGKNFIHERGVSSGDHSFDAHQDGKFEYCFSNEHWSASSKEVSFNVHGIVYVPETEAPGDPLEAEVKQLSELLSQVKDEQSYIVIRERTHRNTAESTNGRVKWWSIFQLGVLLGEGIFQVWWLKRFFEVTNPHGCTLGAQRQDLSQCGGSANVMLGQTCSLIVSR